jgi:lysophospholipase L1-like esterase
MVTHREWRKQTSQVPKARHLDLASRLALAAAAAVLTVAVCEVGFRVTVSALQERRRAAFEHPLLVPTEDPVLEYVLRPGVTRHNPIPGTDAKWTYSVNALGLRGDAPDPGRLHVVILGDSYAFGWAVAEDVTLPRQLQRELDELSLADTVQVLNGGVPGYNTEQQARFLETRWAALDPRALVVTVVVNDGEPQWSIPSSPRQRYRDSTIWLLAEARWRLILLGWNGTSSLNVHDTDYARSFRAGSKKAQRCRAALADILGRAAREDIPILVVMWPDVSVPLDDAYPYRVIHDTLARWTEELNAPFLDLLPTLAGQQAPISVPGDGHPNAQAHQLAAQVIARDMISRWPDLGR